MMGNQARWTVASMPTVGWAKKVFPHLDDAAAVAALQEVILTACRADGDDPVLAWAQHTAQMQARLERMNAYRFAALHYTSANGTDFTIGLADDHLWVRRHRIRPAADPLLRQHPDRGDLHRAASRAGGRHRAQHQAAAL